MARARIAMARQSELPSIKRLADDNKPELGFVLLPALRAAICERRVLTVQLGVRTVGFAHFRNRRDGVTKIYQVCVDQGRRRRGYGRKLLGSIENLARATGQKAIILSCPEGLTANRFYRRCGYAVERVEPGKVRRLVVWRRQLAD